MPFPVAEPIRAKTEPVKAERWIDNIMVKESLDPAIGVTFLSFGHGGILTFLPIHALKIGLANPGIWFGVYAACILLSRPIAGPISDKVSRRAVIIPGLILNLAGIVLLAFATTSNGLMAAAIIGGFGTGAAQPALMTQAVDRSDGQRRGQSLAQFQFFYDLGIGIGSLTLGALLDLVDQSFRSCTSPPPAWRCSVYGSTGRENNLARLAAISFLSPRPSRWERARMRATSMQQNSAICARTNLRRSAVFSSFVSASYCRSNPSPKPKSSSACRRSTHAFRRYGSPRSAASSRKNGLEVLLVLTRLSNPAIAGLLAGELQMVYGGANAAAALAAASNGAELKLVPTMSTA